MLDVVHDVLENNGDTLERGSVVSLSFIFYQSARALKKKKKKIHGREKAVVPQFKQGQQQRRHSYHYSRNTRT